VSDVLVTNPETQLSQCDVLVTSRVSRCMTDVLVTSPVSQCVSDVNVLRW